MGYFNYSRRITVGGTMVKSYRNQRSREQEMDDKLMFAHPDKGCNRLHQDSCLKCTKYRNKNCPAKKKFTGDADKLLVSYRELIKAEAAY